MEKSCPGKEGHPPRRVNFSEHLFEKKVDRANSPRACSDLSSDCLGFFCFLFNKRSPEDAARKTEFFAYVISRKRRANQWKKNTGQCLFTKTKPTYKNH